MVSIGLLLDSHQDKKLTSAVPRFPWNLRAVEEQQRLPRVYFIIRSLLPKPMISQPIILLQRQHGVELGGPGQAMGLVEMELREDIVSQTIYSCFISSPEISITSGDLFLLLKFLHKIRFLRLAKISLRFALGVLDMDTITQRFTGNWSL